MARRKSGGRFSGEVSVNWDGDSITSGLLAVQVFLTLFTLLQFFHANALRKLPENRSYRGILRILLAGCAFLTIAYGFHIGEIVIENSDSPLGQSIAAWVGFFLTINICYIIGISLIFFAILGMTYLRATAYGTTKEIFWKIKNIADGCLLVTIIALDSSYEGVYSSAVLAYDPRQPREFLQAVAQCDNLDIAESILYILVSISICAGIIKLNLQAKRTATVDKVVKSLMFAIPAVVIRTLFAIAEIVISILKPSYDRDAYTLARVIIRGLALFVIISLCFRPYEVEPATSDTDSDTGSQPAIVVSCQLEAGTIDIDTEE